MTVSTVTKTISVTVATNIVYNTFWLAIEIERLLQVTLVREIFC